MLTVAITEDFTIHYKPLDWSFQYTFAATSVPPYTRPSPSPNINISHHQSHGKDAET
jgi:hypothetical protein